MGKLDMSGFYAVAMQHGDLNYPISDFTEEELNFARKIAGIVPTNEERKHYRPRLKQSLEPILKDALEGMTIIDLADKYNCDPKQIKNLLRKQHITSINTFSGYFEKNNKKVWAVGMKYFPGIVDLNIAYSTRMFKRFLTQNNLKIVKSTPRAEWNELKIGDVYVINGTAFVKTGAYVNNFKKYDGSIREYLGLENEYV